MLIRKGVCWAGGMDHTEITEQNGVLKINKIFQNFYYNVKYRWKFTELEKYLPRDVYKHFLTLFCASTICSSEIYTKYLDLANVLLTGTLR